ncbi:AAA domain-containing protein [Fictibacillus sp. WQ 8-8]|uniref:AAA domain-containing protein n=1 Tax=Fictibacillus sp. WQ 8-8 TaxID=2938788 RepID=UPI00210C31A5|nr:AAA domain-containing protein [Fictibacillus sp. WQ 8-8]MCQ6265131.1 AAA domain-containing protein [Fictibacillus sp. WQ 8-8]
MKQKLINLKDRLNDLSKRNRSIRMLKIYDKWAFDLSNLLKLDKDPLDVIKRVLEQKGNISLLKQDVNNDKTQLYSAKLNNLYRNMKAIEEETGLYDLYMGYPYITGNMLDGTYVRAPLFLYPVRLEKEKAGGTKWTLVLENEDPQLNRTLFLALKKLSGINFTEELYEEAVQESKTLDFLKWTTWLKKHSFNLLWSSKGDLQPFSDFKQNEVPEFNKGQFQLENMAILGNFPQGNSALLKDYEDLLEIANDGPMGIMGTLLGADDSNNDEKDDSEEIIKEIPEAERFLVLDTDASQEEIIKELDKNKGLVIHGPPGTGKSQVIVNLIANVIAKNKKVLLVCQKRAALDVVYQRLDSIGLSKQVALLHDEKSDRKSLYARIHSLLDDDSQYVNYENELLMLSNKIQQYESELNAIAKGLYEVQPHGFKAYELYGLGKPITEIEVILDLENILRSLNKENFEDVLSKILSYGSYYGRFGNEQYPLKNRKSFTKLDLKDRLTLIEILKNIIEKAEKSVEYLETFEQNEITPEYTWLISDKLEKIYEDLNPEEKKSLQKLRLWWWTSFTGKTIVEELLNGEKFKGLSSKEWPKLRESLRILFELSKVSEKMSKEINSLKTYFNDDSILKINHSISKGDIPVNDFKQKQEFIIQDFEELRFMDRTYDESLPFLKLILDRLKNKTNDNVHSQLANEWVDIVKQSAYIHWIDEIENKHPSLSKIGTEELDNIRKEFKKILKKKRDLAAKVLTNRLLKWLHQSKQSNSKQFRELKHQVGKKRMVWPVRKLVRQFSLNGLLDAMPIWLTSPESVSAIFPLEKELFDVVIFDEASQCTVENGIPSVYRGKKIIVAGDEKQLPPSNLFKGDTHIDEEEEEDDIEHSESLLNLSKRILPEKMLQWHYRSKFEELINFSNHAYYNGNIQIAPNVTPLKDPAAIKWHKITNGKWINQCNEAEAMEVVNLLKEIVIKEPNKSIGIITFNAKQQDKILDIIESEVEKDKEFSVVYQQIMSKDLDERIFVKNIENVQGDERDTIIFSIAYARNEQGKVYSRFGTLSQQGGENRLNVAVSRAKEQIHVVSSIEPAELNVTNAKNDGPKLLKNYLEYSKAVSNVNKDEIEAIVTKINENHNTKKQDLELWFDSPFEEQVYKQLIDLGYKVDTQIGMSGYRIDMAVVHPNHPQKYILGIECDGAMFHSAASAKERDVYRQRFLESKGWKITRIWSRNWWKNASLEIERIDHLIKQVLNEEKSKEKVSQL